MNEREFLASLQAENARLTALLESHGIAWRLSKTCSGILPMIGLALGPSLLRPLARSASAEWCSY